MAIKTAVCIFVHGCLYRDGMCCVLQTFGEIDYVRFLKDRNTGDSRGLAYVKFFRSYHAALALEGCNPRKPLLRESHTHTYH